MHAQSFLFIKNARVCMCIILIMIEKKGIIFLINSSPSHCRLTLTNSIFFISYIRNVKTVNTFLI